jgi:hypothetical protein
LKMGNVRELHDKAMGFAQLAMVAFHMGQLEKARLLARQGYEYEAQAAYMVPKRGESEPTRGILYRSAATLAWQCEEFPAALQLIREGLSNDPPGEIERELLDLRDEVAAQWLPRQIRTGDNPPRRGTCSYCYRRSVRLLDPPLLEIALDALHRAPPIAEICPGDTVWWDSGSSPDPYEVVEVQEGGGRVICLASEAVRGELYCYLCFDGHIWPAIRERVLNMPPEMRFDPQQPWVAPRWVSRGRELRWKARTGGAQ